MTARAPECPHADSEEIALTRKSLTVHARIPGILIALQPSKLWWAN
jgi:hypothetical protein